MKNLKQLFIFACLTLAVMTAMQTNVFGQLRLNEIESDPPSEVDDSCQYVELRGTPNSTIAANTYFLSVDGDAGNQGIINEVASLGGVTIGSNGTVTIINDPDITGNTCRNLSGIGTTVVLADNFFGLTGQGGESFLLVTTPGPINFSEGTDIDANNDGGNFDPQFPVTFIDGIAYTQDTASNRAYGGAPILLVNLNAPDAATRFSNDLDAFDATAWYFGELAASPDNTTTYVDPRSPNFPTGGVLTPGAPNLPSLVAPGKATVDFNGDGRTDYSVTRNVSGLLNWYTSINGTSETRFVQLGLAGDVPVPEDFDGDGKDDLAVWRSGAAFSAGFYILQSSNNTFRSEVFGQTGDNPGLVGDWDGDGKADPAVYRAGAAGAQSVFYFRGSNNNPNGNITFTSWGLGGDKPARGDYDGDGRLDAAVFRPSNAVWYILQSSNQQVRYDYFGAASDTLVTADYDGDNKTDLAVFRSGVWWVKQSSDNSVSAVNWGVASDILIPGDYTGDGRDDYAVWRDGAIFIAAAGSANVTITNWGLAGDFPVANVYTE